MADLSKVTKEMLEAERDAARQDARDIERRLEKVIALVGSAQIRMQSALAIFHLQQHNPGLVMTGQGATTAVIAEAVIDLDKAVTTADLLPF